MKNAIAPLQMKLSHLLVAILSLGILISCSSTSEHDSDVDPAKIENAIFACKKEIQEKRKARFEELNPLIKRLLGENQILGEFENMPTRGQISRAIRKFPLEGDSGGKWGAAKDSHARTISNRVERLTPSENDPTGLELFVMSIGQRSYSFPLKNLRRHKFSTAVSGLSGSNLNDTLQLRTLDEHHILVVATHAGNQAKTDDPESRFNGGDFYAVVRTYLEQSYRTESQNQLPDYPVSGPGLDDTACDQAI